MYRLSARVCRVLFNLVANPWECLPRYRADKLCSSVRNILDSIMESKGPGINLYFDVAVHPVTVSEGIVFRAYLTVVSKDPALVIGVVDRIVLNDTVLELYFTDEFGDHSSLRSVTFYTYGTEGLRFDTMDKWSNGFVGIE